MENGITLLMVTATGCMKKSLNLQERMNGVQRETILLIIVLMKAGLRSTNLPYLTAYTINNTATNIRRRARKIRLLTYIFTTFRPVKK